MERLPDPPVDQPKPVAIPPGIVACANCLFAQKGSPKDPNFLCFADPPRIIQAAPKGAFGPQGGLVSIRPAVQPQHFCRHFSPSPQAEQQANAVADAELQGSAPATS